MGSSIVSRLLGKMVQRSMGLALLIVAVIVLVDLFKIMSVDSVYLELYGIKLVIGDIGNFILGALVNHRHRLICTMHGVSFYAGT